MGVVVVSPCLRMRVRGRVVRLVEKETWMCALVLGEDHGDRSRSGPVACF